MRFGTNGDGNYGYYGDDDILIPFRRIELIVANGANENPVTYTFTKSYAEAYLFADVGAAGAINSPYIKLNNNMITSQAVYTKTIGLSWACIIKLTSIKIGDVITVGASNNNYSGIFIFA